MEQKKKNWEAGQWYNEASKEFKQYKKTGRGIKLAQAGEKLWNAFTLHLDKKYGKELTNYKEIKEAVKKDPAMKKIFDDAYWMHIFFYRGFTEDITMEEGKFRNVARSLQKVM